MGVKRVVYIVASHASEANSDMFFISVLNITAGGACINIDFVFIAFTGIVQTAPPRDIILSNFRCHSLAQGSAGRCCLYTYL